jgi:regulatory protein
MKITVIKPAVRTPGRYLIFLDDSYSFSLSESALLKSNLAAGQELSRAEVNKYKLLSVDDKLYNRALALVAARAKTSWEVETYLSGKGASPALITEILNKLSKIGLIDDQKYAHNFVVKRLQLRPTSKRKLIAELKKKHVNEQFIEQALTNQSSDINALQAVVASKLRQAKYHDRMKLMQYLARQGFNYHDIKSVLEASDVGISEI